MRRGGVLRLVQNHERARQGAPAHKGERCHFDRALFHQPGALFAHDFEQRIVKRTQIGIDLFPQVAGKETQPLASLKCRAGQNDAFDPPFVKQMRGKGGGEKGLAGARGSDAEHQRVAAHHVEILRLRGRTGADGAAGRCLDRRCAQSVAGVFRLLMRGEADFGIHLRQGDGFTGFHARVKRPQNRSCPLASIGRAFNTHQIAAHRDAHAEFLFDANEILLMRTGKASQFRVV